MLVRLLSVICIWSYSFPFVFHDSIDVRISFLFVPFLADRLGHRVLNFIGVVLSWFRANPLWFLSIFENLVNISFLRRFAVRPFGLVAPDFVSVIGRVRHLVISSCRLVLVFASCVADHLVYCEAELVGSLLNGADLQRRTADHWKAVWRLQRLARAVSDQSAV